MLVKRLTSFGPRSAGVLVVTALWVVAAPAASVDAQAITCPTGQMPVPIMPRDGSAPAGPVKMKCATPQEAMEMMAAVQQEMMKKLSASTLGAPPASSANPNGSALPGPGHQPATDPVLASAHSIAAGIESGRLILRAVRFSPDGAKMTAPDDASIMIEGSGCGVRVVERSFHWPGSTTLTP